MRTLLVLAFLTAPVAWGRSPRVIPAAPNEISQQLLKKDVRLRLTDGSSARGKLIAGDATGVRLKRRWRPEQTFAWSSITGVRHGFTTTKWIYVMAAGTIVSTSFVASAAPVRRHPAEAVPIAFLGGMAAAALAGRPIEYRPLR